jgi:hypothetical protein
MYWLLLKVFVLSLFPWPLKSELTDTDTGHHLEVTFVPPLGLLVERVIGWHVDRFHIKADFFSESGVISNWRDTVIDTTDKKEQ